MIARRRGPHRRQQGPAKLLANGEISQASRFVGEMLSAGRGAQIEAAAGKVEE